LPIRIPIHILFILALSQMLPFHITAGAAEFNIASETILRSFQREDTDGDKITAIPVYEYLGIDWGDPEYGGFSFHANGWGRVDLGDQEYYQNDPEGYILDGYFQYSKPENGLDIKLGRQHIYAGIVNTSVDGIGFRGNAGSHVSLLAYGGYPVGYEDDNGRTGDGTYGGRIGLEELFPGELGVSYKKLDNDSNTIDNKLGADLSVYLFNRFVFSGLSFWNLETEDWGEHSYAADLYVSQFSLEAHYQMFPYGDYFSGNTDNQMLSYLQDTDETLTILGGNIIWQQFHGFDTGLKLNHYTYDIRQETSQYMAVVLNLYGQADTSVGAEAGIMDGESAANSYYLGRIYFYWDAPSFMKNWFVDGEFMYVGYKEEIYGRDSSIFSSAGCGRKILNDAMKIKISGDYSSDPYNDSDISIMTVVQIEY